MFEHLTQHVSTALTVSSSSTILELEFMPLELDPPDCFQVLITHSTMIALWLRGSPTSMPASAILPPHQTGSLTCLFPSTLGANVVDV